MKHLGILLKGRFSQWDRTLSSKEVNEPGKDIHKTLPVIVTFTSTKQKDLAASLKPSTGRRGSVNMQARG